MMELRPIIVDEKGIILGGNMRYQALKALGYKEIPDTWVKNVDTLTEEEKQRFVVSDNVQFGDWDWDVLANEFEINLLANWGVDVPIIEGPGDEDFSSTTKGNEIIQYNIIFDDTEQYQSFIATIKKLKSEEQDEDLTVAALLLKHIQKAWK